MKCENVSFDIGLKNILGTYLPLLRLCSDSCLYYREFQISQVWISEVSLYIYIYIYI
jgi:hypothetical protein